ncbi:hypothetical protein [Modestobacter caceresii]|jgi:hypothetical protein|nr:hypothetical protein [Modestobacter caceresii]
MTLKKLRKITSRTLAAASQALADPRTATLVGLAGLVVSVVQRC